MRELHGDEFSRSEDGDADLHDEVAPQREAVLGMLRLIVGYGSALEPALLESYLRQSVSQVGPR